MTNNINMITDGERIEKIEDGCWLLESGTASIGTVSGGEVWALDGGEVKIGTISGGVVHAYDGGELTVKNGTRGKEK